MADSMSEGTGRSVTHDSIGTAPTIDDRDIPASRPGGSAPTLQPPVVSVSPEYAEPARIGRYVIIRRLGQGGMGIVYLAYDPQLDRKVAIKMLREDLDAGAQGRARVQREAQAMAQVSHPNIAHVYEVGESAGRLYLVMEYVAGTSLASWQRARPRNAASVEEILRIYLQAGEGLMAAHRAGLIHRDFKPDNVLVDDESRARVVDFGLARALSGPSLPYLAAAASHAILAAPANPAQGQRLTQSGAMMGTPGYMSPEQIKGIEADARSDQFSFCAALYEALYRRLPFAGEDVGTYACEVLADRVLQPPPGEVPLVVENAILRGLSGDPSARFPSLEELIAALRKGLHPDSESPVTRRAGRWFGLVVSLYSVIVGALSLRQGLRVNSGSLRSSLITILVFMVGFAGALFALRRILLRRTTYRQLAYFGIVIVCYVATARGLGYALEVSRHHYFPLEICGMAALMATEAPHGVRRLGWFSALLGISGVLVALWPQLEHLIVNTTYPITVIALFFYRMTAASPAAPGAPDNDG
jgi:serine/threonine protein kinase